MTGTANEPEPHFTLAFLAISDSSFPYPDLPGEPFYDAIKTVNQRGAPPYPEPHTDLSNDI